MSVPCKVVELVRAFTRNGRSCEGLGRLLVADDSLLEARNAGAGHGGGHNVGHDAAVLQLVIAVKSLGSGQVSKCRA